MKNVQVFLNLFVVSTVLVSSSLFADDTNKVAVAESNKKTAVSSTTEVANKTTTASKSTNGPFSQPISGKVIEKINTTNYTYLKIKTKTDETWVAVPLLEIKLNTEVEVRKPLPMFGFKSKELKRKFDRLYFGMLASQADAVPTESNDKKIKQ